MKHIITAHGTGGRTAYDLIENVFKPIFASAGLSPISSDDAATFCATSPQLLMTTDTHVIEPIFFPGGNIGTLAISGVVNDLLTRGGKPKYMSLGFILEEGLAIESLKSIVVSIATSMKDCGLELLCADTKVIASRSESPGLMITSTLVGEAIRPDLSLDGPKVGDDIIVTGPLGTHGLAILQAREKFPFHTEFQSDCAPLLDLLKGVLETSNCIHYMRDPTRGGVSGVLHELSLQFKISFELTETKSGTGPSLPAVRAALSILGLDPLDVANEGVMLLFVSPSETAEVLSNLKKHPLGEHASVIGSVVPKQRSAVILKTEIGGSRPISWPEGLSLPRIC